MKGFLFLILFLSIFFNGFSQTEYPDSGFTNKAEAKNLMVNGLKEGKWVEYDTCLKPDSKGDTVHFACYYWLRIYKDNLPNGIVREYYMNGKLLMEVHFKNGAKHGIEKGYYNSGKLMYICLYKDGKENGVSEFYYESGGIEREATYTGGEFNGMVKNFAEDGKLLSKVYYRNGVQILTKRVPLKPITK